ncbi:MAG: hypothetical protein EOP34_03525 [Rickettsiales bacterium]|nr:MAG: hypothetical protein EOP34_03525 [Rickettsiales bacterium]
MLIITRRGDEVCNKQYYLNSVIQGNQDNFEIKIDNVKYNGRLGFSSRTFHRKGIKVGHIRIASETMPPICFLNKGVLLGVGKVICRGLHR